MNNFKTQSVNSLHTKARSENKDVISKGYFDELIRKGLNQRQATRWTLYYLLGFFQNNMTVNEDLRKVLEVVEKEFTGNGLT